MTTGSSETAFEEFLGLWSTLRSESTRPGTVVVVEGDRDRDSLRALGLQGPIVLVHRGVPLSALAHALTRGTRRAIVLTDWDATGGQLAHKLNEFLAPGPVAVDLEFRRRLARVLRGEVVHVEGIHGWARRLAERTGAPLEHYLEREGEAGGEIRG
ncbi:MAG: topoisomerase [Thermoplasmata archaeon]|nr:topoisomerase [Thermoplasmata archaeon]MCI4359362.1 topoisomerase [Thermoplasmata archaeon]